MRQNFSASGRFCSLRCVGVSTGRQNKGREFVRQFKTTDKKVLKKKKKKKVKVKEERNGSEDDPLYNEGHHFQVTTYNSLLAASSTNSLDNLCRNRLVFLLSMSKGSWDYVKYHAL